MTRMFFSTVPAKSQLGTEGTQKVHANYDYCVFARIAARFPVTAWKPEVTLFTVTRDRHVLHWRKRSRESLDNSVSGD